MSEQPTVDSRTMLKMIQAKYDGGGMPQAVHKVLENLEREVAWEKHKEQAK